MAKLYFTLSLLRTSPRHSLQTVTFQRTTSSWEQGSRIQTNKLSTPTLPKLKVNNFPRPQLWGLTLLGEMKKKGGGGSCPQYREILLALPGSHLSSSVSSGSTRQLVCLSVFAGCCNHCVPSYDIRWITSITPRAESRHTKESFELDFLSCIPLSFWDGIFCLYLLPISTTCKLGHSCQQVCSSGNWDSIIICVSVPVCTRKKLEGKRPTQSLPSMQTPSAGNQYKACGDSKMWLLQNVLQDHVIQDTTQTGITK